MGTNYTGNRALVNDPVAAPEAGRQPAAVVPIDTDPPNASTFQAGYKSAMDWIDWLRRPIAKVADWANPLKRYQTAQGHTRFRVDHMGFPGGWFQEMSPNWIGAASLNVALAADVALVPGWLVNGSAAAGALAVDVAASDYPALRLNLSSASVADHLAIKTTDAVAQFNDTVCAVLEGVFRVEHPSVPVTRDHVIGMGIHASGSVVDWDNVIRFRYNQGSTGTGTVLAESRSGAAITTVNTGLLPAGNATVPFRIEFHGATVGDNATKRALFFIDGNLVANITTNLPPSGVGFRLFAGWKAILSGGGTENLHIGPLKFRSSITTTDAK